MLAIDSVCTAHVRVRSPLTSQLHPAVAADIVLDSKEKNLESAIVAIGLEFIDVVIPIARIRESYPGGWDQCQRDYAALLGRRVWYDQHLFRDGAMDPSQVRMLVEGWAVLGFEPMGKRPTGLYWKDVCVINWRQGGPTAPCDWLAFDPNSRTAHLAGTEPGPLAWRGQPKLKDAS